MTHLELYDYFNLKYPPSLSMEWDNDGLMCCNNHRDEVKRVLLTLDATYAAIRYAKENGFDVIITHHPLVFRPLSSLNSQNFIADKLILAVQSGITVMSFHTRLDAAVGGVNDALAEKLGLSDIIAVSDGTEQTPLCRIGTLPAPMPLSDFASYVKKQLSCKSICYAGESTVSKVAVLGGAGKDFVEVAKQNGADTFVCGEIDYNSMLDWCERKMNIIQAGHFETEQPVLYKIGNELEGLDIPFDIYLSDKTYNI